MILPNNHKTPTNTDVPNSSTNSGCSMASGQIHSIALNTPRMASANAAFMAINNPLMAKKAASIRMPSSLYARQRGKESPVDPETASFLLLLAGRQRVRLGPYTHTGTNTHLL